MSKNVIPSLVSVIVPVYNVEKYVEKCISSVMNQTYRNIEIILIDDGSKDHSGELCDKYKDKDQRISVIHQLNGGLSCARNTGLDIAKGEYIVFVDSDDMIHPQMIETLYNTATRGNCKLVICDYEKTYSLNIEPVKKNSISMKEYSQEELFYEYYNDLMYPKIVVAWNKLYHNSVFAELRYEPGRIHEDEFLIIDLITKVDRAIFVEASLYYYYMREDSIMNRKYNIKRLDLLDALRNHINYFKTNGKTELAKLANFRYCDYIIENYFKCKRSHLRNEATSLKEQFTNEWKNEIHLYKMRLPKKIKYQIFLHMPALLGFHY